jgi:hypothetical protein
MLFLQEDTELQSLQRAHRSLQQQAQALLQEWQESEVVEEAANFETQFLEEQTARELGTAGALALGLAVLHSTAKAVLPARVAAPVVGASWLVGGAFIVFRLTAGTIAGWVAQSERNTRRKRRLQRKLEAIEDRIRLLLATQQSLAAVESKAQGATEAVAASSQGPGKKVSPTSSSGSSAELVEAPEKEESGEEARRPSEGSSGAGTSSSLEGWRSYARLGSKKRT